MRQSTITTFRAAVRNGNYWTLTDNVEHIMRQQDADVLFVDNIDALHAEVDNQNPHDLGEGFSRTRVTHTTAVEVSDQPKATTTDINVLKELARQHGRVESWSYFNLADDMLKEGFFFEPDSSRRVLIYDPKMARKMWLKERANARRLALRQYVTCYDVRLCLHKFAQALQDRGFPTTISDLSNRDRTLRALQSAISMFDVTFTELGRRPFRRFGPFLTLVRQWRRLQVNSGLQYRKAGGIATRFADWMDVQAAGRLPKAMELEEKSEPEWFAVR